MPDNTKGVQEERAVGHRFYGWLQDELSTILYQMRPYWDDDTRSEAVQISQIRVWRQIDQGGKRYDQISRAYLKRVAFTVLVDEFRAVQRRREDSLDVENAAEPLALGADPERRFAAHELGQQIQNALQALKKEYRQALVLSLQGHSVNEVALLLGIGYKAAENRLTRGRSRLRQALVNER